MTDQQNKDDSGSILDKLVDEVVTQLRAGDHIDFDLYAKHHPRHVAELKELLPALTMLAALPEIEGSDGGQDAVSLAPVHGHLDSNHYGIGSECCDAPLCQFHNIPAERQAFGHLARAFPDR